MIRPLLNVASAIVVVMLFARNTGCRDKQNSDKEVIKKLYEEYSFGQIEACTFNNQKVYHAGINAFDAGSKVYDEKGNTIATCNFATRMVDEACEKLEDCETIYRCENHISGNPPVDKYNLTKNENR